MSREDLDKWEARYAGGAYTERPHPSPWVTAQVPAAEPGASRPRALDLACGAGRNALYLARQGYDVDAIDISPAGLTLARAATEAQRLSVRWHAHDLDRGLPADLGSGFQIALVIRFVRLDLLPELIAALTPGGLLVVELHLRSEAEVAGPTSPAFRVPPRALADALGGLRIEAYEEGLITDPDGRTVALARAAARRTD